MGDVNVVGWLGRGCGSPVGGGCAFESYTQFTMAVYVELGSPSNLFLVYFLGSIPLRSRRLQLTSVGSPDRDRLSAAGYRS